MKKAALVNICVSCLRLYRVIRRRQELKANKDNNRELRIKQRNVIREERRMREIEEYEYFQHKGPKSSFIEESGVLMYAKL